MSHSTTLIPPDSTRESVGSSPSLVILSDTKAEVMAILVVLPEISLEAAAIVAPPTATLDPAIEFNLEVEPSEALPSPDHVPSSPIHAPASLDYHPGPDTEFEPIEDESEPIEDAPEVVEPLPAQVAPQPPIHSTPTLPTSSVEPTPTPPIIPHDTRVTARMTVQDSTSLSGSSLTAPSISRPGLSRKRSRHVSSSSSSSSSTSRLSSGPLPRRRHLISSYSTPSASVGPSRKRCRSPATSLLAAASTTAVLSSVPADRLPPRKRLRGSLAVSYHDVTIEATTKPPISPVYDKLMVKERLDEESEVIREMYAHLLEIPLHRLEEIEEELRALRARVMSSEKENTSLLMRDATPGERHCRAVAAVSDCSDARQRAHLEDRGVPSQICLGSMYLIVPFQVFSIWKAFGGNTRDLGSFGEETDKTTDLHQHLLRISTQKLETASHITRDAVTTHLKTASRDP
ncbi:hypothetical protein Tco_1217012 [Tanacetum coccineum]